MNEKELLAKINSDYTANIFKCLYGEHEIDAARLRYSALINEMLNNAHGGFPETELCVTCGNPQVFSSPGRTELAGNHTDHNRGKVLAASVQLDCAAIVKKRNDNIVFFRSAGFHDVKVKLTDENGRQDLEPKPEETGTTESLVRGIASEFRRRGYKTGGFSANAASSVLPGSGLSSSAAVEVLFCRIFSSLYNEGRLNPLEIAQISQTAENAYFGKPCGLMDQAACATGGTVAIDFADAAHPEIKKINFDPASSGYALCIVNTGGSHADLTADYASIPSEMKAVAAFFGKSVLSELEKENILSRAAEIRKALGDRALLRSLHFFDENMRVDAMITALAKMEDANSAAGKQQLLDIYMELVNESGNSSLELLQNVYSPLRPDTQNISTALALTKDFFRRQKLKSVHPGACRVHGGGFAGTIQVYIPLDTMNEYRAYIEKIFGADSVTPLRIRQAGAVELV